MIEVRQTEVFKAWIAGLRDRRSAARIAGRIVRLANGAWGDVKPVGDGVSELRIHTGPGYRVYVIQRGEDLIVVLGGGDKSTQDDDIAKARRAAAEL